MVNLMIRPQNKIKGRNSTFVRLSDGRSQEIYWDKPFRIEGTDVHAAINFDFRPVDLDTLLGKAFAEVFVMRCGVNAVSTLKPLNNIIVALVRSGHQEAALETNVVMQVEAEFVMGLKAVFYSFLRDVAEYNPECFTPDCIDHLAYFRSPRRPSYGELRKNDPEKGAYTEQELYAIRGAVNQAFEDGRIDLREFAFIWTLIATGLRPIQICKLRISDVKIIAGPDGREVNLLVPLVKGPQSAPKATKWIRRCPSVLAKILIRYLDVLSIQSARQLDPNARLFGYADYDIDNLFKANSSYKGRIAREVVAHSERTGGPIRINPTRFRYTLATRAVAFGASDHEVARLMTHRSITPIQHYRAALPTIMKPIKAALGNHMDLIASAFQGRLIDGLS